MGGVRRGAEWGPSGLPCGDVARTSWAIQTDSGARMAVLVQDASKPSSGHFGTSWGPPGSVLVAFSGHLGASSGLLGGLLGSLGGFLKDLGASGPDRRLRRQSWRPLWGVFGPSWGPHGLVLIVPAQVRNQPSVCERTPVHVWPAVCLSDTPRSGGSCRRGRPPPKKTPQQPCAPHRLCTPQCPLVPQRLCTPERLRTQQLCTPQRLCTPR